MSWVFQILASILILACVSASETKKNKLFFFFVLLVYGAVQYYVYSTHPSLPALFPQLSFQHGQTISAAQYHGYALYGDTCILYLPLLIPCVALFGYKLLRTHDRKKKTTQQQMQPAKHTAKKTVTQQDSSLWQYGVSAALWFHIFLFGWSMIVHPSVPLTREWMEIAAGISCIFSFFGGKIIHRYTRFIDPKKIQLALALSVLVHWIIYTFIGMAGYQMTITIVALAGICLLLPDGIYKKIPWSATQESLVIILSGILFTLPYLTEKITTVTTDFDAQNFLTWAYTATRGYLPNKDIFYLYGFMTYWQSSNALLRYTYSLFFVSLLLLLYLLLKKVSSSAFFASVVHIGICILIYTCGYWPSSRFLIPFVGVGWITYCLATQKKPYVQLISGALSGMLFFLFVDAGLITCVVSGIVILIHEVAATATRPLRVLQNIVKSLVRFGIGIAIGSAPFLFTLFHTGSLKSYVDFFLITTHIDVYGKVLYFTNGWMTRDFPVSLLLWTACLLLAYVFMFQKKIFRTPLLYVTLGWTGILFAFQIKNTIHPLGDELAGAIFLSVVILLLHLWEYGKKQSYRRPFILLTLTVCALLYLPVIFSIRNVTDKIREVYYLYTENWILLTQNTTIYSSIRQRTEMDMTYIQKTIDSEYLQVTDWLHNQPDSTDSIVSYPCDPIFSVLLNQKPLPFFNPYDGSPKSAQLANINFMQNKAIRYVIYNPDCSMGGVPIAIRNAYGMAYLFKHFTPVQKIGNFVIFKKMTEPTDPLGSAILKEFASLWQDLMDIPMENIPKSEGKTYRSTASRQTQILAAGTLTDINRYLTETPVSSEHLSLIVSSTTKGSAFTTLQINANNEKQTILHFNTCIAPDVCLIHLERLPLFYINRQINSIDLVDGNSDTYQLIQMEDNNIQW